jgi:hypothetical protein
MESVTEKATRSLTGLSEVDRLLGSGLDYIEGLT